MDLKEFLDILNSGAEIEGGSETHLFMHGVSQEALRVTAEINGSYHEPAELRALMEKLTGEEIDESFGLFPPFYTDCGKNIRLSAKTSLSTPAAGFRTRAGSGSATTR